MRSFIFATLLSTLAISSLVIAAPQQVEKRALPAKRQFIDYGPPQPINCNTASGCPSHGPSGKLNYPYGGVTLTTVYDNSGHVDVSYTPVNTAVGSKGWVKTTSVVFLLRQYFFGAHQFSDSIIILGQLGAPSDFSTIKARLSLPARFYDGDTNDENDVKLAGTGQSGSIGEWAFQVIEQQAYTADKTNGKAPVLIEFLSAAPLVNISFVDSTSFGH